MCTPDGSTVDMVNIIPYIKSGPSQKKSDSTPLTKKLTCIALFINRKYARDPVTGSPLASEDLVKLNFFKNSQDHYYDPVTYKVFNEHTHIVAIKTSGNVFSRESIDRLNIKPGHWHDLVTDEKFSRADIITLQVCLP
jgi:peptidyl-prolyl cis-trans isomerase-like protein 2